MCMLPHEARYIRKAVDATLLAARALREDGQLFHGESFTEKELRLSPHPFSMEL